MVLGFSSRSLSYCFLSEPSHPHLQNGGDRSFSLQAGSGRLVHVSPWFTLEELLTSGTRVSLLEAFSAQLGVLEGMPPGVTSI